MNNTCSWATDHELMIGVSDVVRSDVMGTCLSWWGYVEVVGDQNEHELNIIEEVWNSSNMFWLFLKKTHVNPNMKWLQ